MQSQIKKIKPTCVITADSFNNKFVKIFFKNGTICSGKVILWSDDRSVLLDEATNNVLYIYNTKENVMMIKMSNSDLDSDSDSDSYSDSESLPIKPSVVPIDYKNYTAPITPIVEPDPPEINKSVDPSLRTKKLADLRIAKTKAMREDIAKRMKTFVPSNVVPVSYGIPNFKK